MGYCTCYDADITGYKHTHVFSACFGTLFQFMDNKDSPLKYDGYVDVYVMGKEIGAAKQFYNNQLCFELDEVKYLFEKMSKLVSVPEITEATTDEKVKYLPKGVIGLDTGSAYKLHFEFNQATKNRIRSTLILSRYAYEGNDYYGKCAKKALELDKQFPDVPFCELLIFAHQINHCGDGHTISYGYRYPPKSIKSEKSILNLIDGTKIIECCSIFSMEYNTADYRTTLTEEDYINLIPTLTRI